MGIDFVRKRPDSPRIPVNEPHGCGKVLRPPETLPQAPRWFPGLPEMSRTVAGSLRELRKQALFELFQIITVR